MSVDKSNDLVCDKSVLKDFELPTVEAIPSDFTVTDLQQVLVVCKIKAFSLKYRKDKDILPRSNGL